MERSRRGAHERGQSSSLFGFTMKRRNDDRSIVERMSRAGSVSSTLSNMSGQSGSSTSSDMHRRDMDVDRIMNAGESEINAWFEDLMRERNFEILQNDQKSQMKNMSTHNKRLLLRQQVLTGLSPGVRNSSLAPSVASVFGSLSPTGYLPGGHHGDDQDSPDGYVRRLMEVTTSAKFISSLGVQIRTKPVAWVEHFIEAQGHHCVGQVLSQINLKPNPSSADLDREYELAKCFKSLYNVEHAVEEALVHYKIIQVLLRSLHSPRPGTRKIVSEVLTYLIYYKEGKGHHCIVRAFDLEYRRVVGDRVNNTNDKFKSWLMSVHQALSERGIFGSLVGASAEIKSAGVSSESQMVDYALASVLLMHALTAKENCHDLAERVHIRSQFGPVRVKKLFDLMHSIGSDRIDQAIARYEDEQDLDNDEISLRAEDEPVLDTSDAADMARTIAKRLQGTEAESDFASALQHLVLLRNGNQSQGPLFKLLSELISHLVMNVISPGSDPTTLLGVPVQQLLDRLAADGDVRRAIMERTEALRQLQQARAERDEMEKLVMIGADGNVGRLQQKLNELNGMLELYRRQNRELEEEREDLIAQHAHDMQERELQQREMLMMMRQLKEAQLQPTGPNKVDRERLVERLEHELASNLAVQAPAATAAAHAAEVDPSPRLRALRDQMEALELEARELELQAGDDREQDLHAARLKNIKRLQQLEAESIDLQRWMNDSRVQELVRQLRDLEEKARMGIATEPVTITVSSQSSQVQSQSNNVGHTSNDNVTKGPRNKLAIPENLAAAIAQHVQKQSDASTGAESTVKSDTVTGTETNGSVASSVSQPGMGPISGVPGPGVPLPATAIDKPKDLKANLIPQAGTNGTPPPPPPPPPPPGPSSLSTFGKEPAPSLPPPPPVAKMGILKTPKSESPIPPPLPALLKNTPVLGTNSPVPPQLSPAVSGTSTAASTPALVDDTFGPLGLRPKRKLKQIHWDRIDNVEKTIWATAKQPGEPPMAELLLKQGVFDEVERIFSAKEIKRILTSKPNREVKLSFLPRETKQHFEINLHHFAYIPVEETVYRVLQCTDDAMQLNILEFFASPTCTEIPSSVARNLEPYSTDWTQAAGSAEPPSPEKNPRELERSDRIYLELCYNLQSYWPIRSRALLMSVSYDTDYARLTSKLRQLDEACEAVLESVHFQKLMHIILDVGNFMNGRAKQAVGFRLCTLQRLAFTKDEKGTMTFLHYVEKIVRTGLTPEIENFVEELAPATVVARTSVEQLQQECQEYIKLIRNIQNSVDGGKLRDPSKLHPKDRALVKILPALREAREKQAFLSEHLKTTIAKLERTMRMYGEDPSDTNTVSKFFSYFASFTKEYKAVKRENLTREHEQHLYEERRRRMEQQPRMTKPTKKDDTASQNGNSSEAAARNVDLLLEKLKAAGPKSDPRAARRRAARQARAARELLAAGQEDHCSTLSSAGSVVSGTSDAALSAPVADTPMRTPEANSLLSPASNGPATPTDLANEASTPDGNQAEAEVNPEGKPLSGVTASSSMSSISSQRDISEIGGRARQLLMELRREKQ